MGVDPDAAQAVVEDPQILAIFAGGLRVIVVKYQDDDDVATRRA